MIDVGNVWYAYEGGVQALRGVNLEIEDGECIAIIGPNGSGKTTLVKHFNGLLRPARGRVTVNGLDTRQTSVAKLARHVGYVFQNPDHQIFADTVWDEVCFGLHNLGPKESTIKKQARDALTALGLRGLEDAHPATLSRGQRHKLAIASVLAMDPEVIVFDEPTAGLDWASLGRLMRLLRKLNRRGRTIVLVTHNMRLVAENSRRTVVLDRGRVVLDGKTSEILARVVKLDRIYIKPPPVIQLSVELGWSEPALTVKQAFNEIKARLGNA